MDSQNHTSHILSRIPTQYIDTCTSTLPCTGKPSNWYKKMGLKCGNLDLSIYNRLYSETEIYTYYFVLHYTNTVVCWIVIRKLKYGVDLDVLLCIYRTYLYSSTYQLSTTVVCWIVLINMWKIENGRYFDVLLCIYRDIDWLPFILYLNPVSTTVVCWVVLIRNMDRYCLDCLSI